MKNRVIRLFSFLLLPALLGGEMLLPAVNAADTETGEVAAELTDDSAEDVTAEEAATDYSVYGNYDQIVWIEGMDGVVPYPDSESNITANQSTDLICNKSKAISPDRHVSNGCPSPLCVVHLTLDSADCCKARSTQEVEYHESEC